MKQITLFTFIIISISVNAQVWIDNNATWHFDWSNVGYGGYEELHYYQDTLIDGIECEKIEAIRHGYFPQQDGSILYGGSSEYLAGITYVNGDTVFYRHNDEFFTLFNFGAQIGESWVIATDNPQNFNLCGDTSVVNVVDVGVVIINSIDYRTITLESTFGSPFKITGQFIERFGSIGNTLGYAFFPSSRGCDPNGIYHPNIYSFKCFEDDSFNSYNPLGTGCSYSVDIKTEKQTLFSSYPNPVVNELYINTSLEGGQFYSIYNTAGILVYSGKLPKENQGVDVSGLSNGVYFFKMESKSFKFIKE